MKDQEVILFFIKEPLKGQVKSRLAAVLGESIAVDLYRNFVLDTLGTIVQTAKPYRICVHPPDAIPAVAAWLGHQHQFMPQEGRDLGERMERAFEQIFADGYDRAILIGSDIPDLPSTLFSETFDALKESDAVIGPASDGGYYLIGFRKEAFVAEVFHDMPWSTSVVQEQTRRIFRQTGHNVHYLPLWSDVDTVDDLRALVERNTSTAFASARTMRYIGDIITR